MVKPKYLAFGALAIMCAFVGVINSCLKKPQKPSVMVITIDTLRPDHLGSYGYRYQTTPNLDKFASLSVKFINANTQASSTVPSHASMFTSIYPTGTRVLSNLDVLPDSYTTLAELLQEDGYTTAAFVSNMILWGKRGLSQGFDHYDDNFPQHEIIRKIPERTASHTVKATLDWLEAHQGEEENYISYMDFPYRLVINLKTNKKALYIRTKEGKEEEIDLASNALRVNQMTDKLIKWYISPPVGKEPLPLNKEDEGKRYWEWIRTLKSLRFFGNQRYILIISGAASEKYLDFSNGFM